MGQFRAQFAAPSTARDDDPALLAYERCAGYYDQLTADYDHDAWLLSIEQVALAHGLRGRRVLDVACGTGKSALPLIRRGYEVSACDLSPAMVRRARMRLPATARVFVADMRDLPPGGRFDLVTCLDDALNYLLSDDELRAAMRSFASVLARGGLAAFDLNTASTYRRAFGTDCELDAAGGTLRWRGRRSPGRGLFAASVEPIGQARGRWTESVHVQRHHPPAAVIEACKDAGLDVLAVYGQSTGGRLHERVDEDSESKLLYLARNRKGGPT